MEYKKFYLLIIVDHMNTAVNDRLFYRLQTLFAAHHQLTQRKNKVRLQRQRIVLLTVIAVDVHGVDILSAGRADVDNLSMQTLHQRSVFCFRVADDNIIVRHQKSVGNLTLCAEGLARAGGAQNQTVGIFQLFSLRGESLRPAGALAAGAVRGFVTLTGQAVVIHVAVVARIAETDVLTQFETLVKRCFDIRREVDVVGAVFVECLADINIGVGGEPVELVVLLGVDRGVVGRREYQRRVDHAVATRGRGVDEIGHRIGVVGVQAHFEPVAHLTPEVRTHGVTLVARADDDTRLVGVVEREQIAALFVAAVDADVVFLGESGLEDGVLPVGRTDRVGVAVFVGVDSRAEEILGSGRIFARRGDDVIVGVERVVPFAAVGQLTVGVRIEGLLVDVAGVGHGIEHVDFLGHFRETEIRGEGDVVLAVAALLGGDDDHAVGAARTVDGRRGGVFQHLDRLDVVGVDVGQRVGAGAGARKAGVGSLAAAAVGESVNDVERLRVGAEGVGSAHVDRNSPPPVLRRSDAPVRRPFCPAGRCLRSARGCP